MIFLRMAETVGAPSNEGVEDGGDRTNAILKKKSKGGTKKPFSR